MDGQFENTMGRLIKVLKRTMNLPPDLIDHLDRHSQCAMIFLIIRDTHPASG